MRKTVRYPRITPLRALELWSDLLRVFPDRSKSPHAVDQIIAALSNHVKNALVKSRRRKVRR